MTKCEQSLNGCALTKLRDAFKVGSGWTDSAISDMPEIVRGSLLSIAEETIRLLSIEPTKVPDKSVSFEQQGSVSAQAPTERNHAPSDIQTSEIPDNLRNKLVSLIATAIPCDSYPAACAVTAITPYILSTEPRHNQANYWKTCYLLLEAKTKPVSIKETIEHYYDVDLTKYDTPEEYDAACVRAVLDAAGVKYVD